MNSTWQQQRQEMRRSSRYSLATRRRIEELKQLAGANPNNKPESVVAELQHRKLTGQKDARDLNLANVDTREAGALDGFNFAGNKTANGRTIIGRAVGANFDDMKLQGQIKGDINGATMRRARIQDLQAPDINRNGVDDSGSVQARVDFSGGSSIGRRSINVNAYLVSRDRSNNDSSITHGGWQTQCFNEDASFNSAKVINTGLPGSSYDRISGIQMEFRPRATEDDFSIHGARFERATLNMTAAAAIERDNGTMADCKIVHDDEPEAEVKPFNAFDALNGFHRDALEMAAPVAKPVRRYTQATRPAAALAMFGMFG